MTGFGRGESSCETYHVTVELKAVNHRFFETSMRMPRGMVGYEEKVKKILQKTMKRGRVEVNVIVSGEAITETKLVIQQDLLEQYLQAAAHLKREYGLAGELTVQDLLLQPAIAEQVEQVAIDKSLGEHLLASMQDALTHLQKMRQVEGKRLKQDVIHQLESLKKSLEKVKELAPTVIQKYEKRLKNKLADMQELDEQRLLTEILLIADRSDINEEIIRLESHVEQFYVTLEQQDAIGRRMEFLLQEMNREVNTIGSKANDSQIASVVVAMKGSLEKMREQSQNIE